MSFNKTLQGLPWLKICFNTLTNLTNVRQMKLTLAKVLARKYVVSRSCSVLNFLLTSGDFCHLLIAFANSLDSDQAQQNVGPDLDQNCLTP